MNRDYYEISPGASFYEINNDTYKLEIKWSKKVQDDLIILSNYYYNSGYKICSEIVNNANNNIKNDMWFLPCVYLFRQSIELLLKAGLAKVINNKEELDKIFCEVKHDLKLLFEKYKELSLNLNLSLEEVAWIEKYLDSIETIDKNSDLFRYPFKDEFLSQYDNNFLDIVVMANRLLQCNYILRKCIQAYTCKDYEVNLEKVPKFLSFVSHGIGNCSLWESLYGGDFHKQVTGYSKAGEFLFSLYQKEKDKSYVYPMIFLFRNAIELALKQLLYATTDVRVSEDKVKIIRNTHLLDKDLWKNIKPILTYYAKKRNQNLNQLDIAEKYIKKINTIDKNGDTFRYPFNYSFNYKFNNKLIDVENVCTYLLSIFNFLDNCDYMLDDISNYESEMRDYCDWY